MKFGCITVNGTRLTVSKNCTTIVTGNGKIIIDGVEVEGAKDVVDIHVEGDVGRIECHGSVYVSGNVKEGVDCGGSCTCNDVGGKVDCGGSCTCNDVKGMVDAGGSVTCGTVGGDVDAGGSVKMKR